ncbi:MAG: sec-independent protein translocase protein TatA [Planctomycetota bacterium]|jgi:sec-independent protein translocase protein TatA
MLFIAFAGPAELWIVLGIVVIMFGAKKLPGLARAMGSSINQFKQGLADENEKSAEIGKGSNDTPKEGE